MKHHLEAIALSFMIGACMPQDDAREADAEALAQEGAVKVTPEGDAREQSAASPASSTPDAAVPNPPPSVGAPTGGASAANAIPSATVPTTNGPGPSTQGNPSNAVNQQGGIVTNVSGVGNTVSNVRCVSTGNNNTATGAGAIGGSFAPGATGASSGCTNDAVTSAGPLVTEQRAASAFSGVLLTDRLVGELSSGANAVTLKVDQDLIGRVLTTVHGDTLEVGDGDPGKSLETSPDARVTLVVPKLTRASVREAASLSGTGVGDSISVEAEHAGSLTLTLAASETLTIGASGASRAVVQGSAKQVLVTADGSAVVESAVETSSADVTASGASKVTVRATSAIRIKAFGAASITVSGNPAIREVDKSASARVIFLDS